MKKMRNEGVENRLCRWIKMASEDTERARHWLEEGDYSICAFHCQQAVEKFLKALHIHLTQGAPLRTHDLGKLGSQVDIPDRLLEDARLLSLDYAPARYPDAEPESPIPYDRTGCERRLEMAERIINWVRGRLGEEG